MRVRSTGCPNRFVFRAFAVALFCAAITSAFPSAAQENPRPEKKFPPYALIFGTVWDANSRPVYGVKLKIRRADEKKARWEVMSNHTGEFAQRVPAGKADYVITAEIKPPKHSKDWKKPQVIVHVQNEERVDTGLHLTE